MCIVSFRFCARLWQAGICIKGTFRVHRHFVVCFFLGDNPLFFHPLAGSRFFFHAQVAPLAVRKRTKRSTLPNIYCLASALHYRQSLSSCHCISLLVSVFFSLTASLTRESGASSKNQLIGIPIINCMFIFPVVCVISTNVVFLVNLVQVWRKLVVLCVAFPHAIATRKVFPVFFGGRGVSSPSQWFAVFLPFFFIF